MFGRKLKKRFGVLRYGRKAKRPPTLSLKFGYLIRCSCDRVVLSLMQ